MDDQTHLIISNDNPLNMSVPIKGIDNTETEKSNPRKHSSMTTTTITAATTFTAAAPPPSKRMKTIHRIVRDDWTTTAETTVTTSNDNDTMVVGMVRDVPPEPTTEPPPFNANYDQIFLHVFGPSTYSSLLEKGWGYHNIKTITDKNEYHYKFVSYDTKRTFKVYLSGLNDDIHTNIKYNRRLLFVPFMNDNYNSKKILLKENDYDDDLWEDMQNRIRVQKSFVDRHDVGNNGPPIPVSLILWIQLPLPSLSNQSSTCTTCTSDDIFHMIQRLRVRLLNLCKELKIDTKYYTPVIESKSMLLLLQQSSLSSSTVTTMSNISNNTDAPQKCNWWWQPQYTMDYCFESIVQKIVNEGKVVGSSSSATVITTALLEEIEKDCISNSKIPVESIDEDFGMDINTVTDDVVASVIDSIPVVVDDATTLTLPIKGKKSSPSKRTRSKATVAAAAAVRTSNMNQNQKRTRD